uniref:Uncharacterized protein n=1 Tax=Anguilla anguilla TaxID=7936 RepID=A0A0E9QUH3_ANGAN
MSSSWLSFRKLHSGLFYADLGVGASLRASLSGLPDCLKRQ